jgi:hypothetical protein
MHELFVGRRGRLSGMFMYRTVSGAAPDTQRDESAGEPKHMKARAAME